MGSGTISYNFPTSHMGYYGKASKTTGVHATDVQNDTVQVLSSNQDELKVRHETKLTVEQHASVSVANLYFAHY